jgi:hypothetical protein
MRSEAGVSVGRSRRLFGFFADSRIEKAAAQTTPNNSDTPASRPVTRPRKFSESHPYLTENTLRNDFQYANRGVN